MKDHSFLDECNMKILVLNTGSSSIKFKLFNILDEIVLCGGMVEKIGEEISFVKINDYRKKWAQEYQFKIRNHFQAVTTLFDLLNKNHCIDDIDAIGHRIAHGADKFEDSVLINDYVMEKIEALKDIAPLHNPVIVDSIRQTMCQFPEIPNVAVFDTVFHKTIPDYAYIYPLPMTCYEDFCIRKYGFHGISHKYVAETGAKFLGTDFSRFNCVSVHLGSGSSVTAIANGSSLDTSMGLTPLDGIMMGTRCGSIDPGVVAYLNSHGFSMDEIVGMMNQKSGLLGIAGVKDMRLVVKNMEAGDRNAKLAFLMFIWRIKKSIGACLGIMERLDAILFTGGIGENLPCVREKVFESMRRLLGIEIDATLNEKAKGKLMEISSKNSRFKILVVPTNEELEIARDTKRIWLQQHSLR